MSQSGRLAAKTTPCGEISSPPAWPRISKKRSSTADELRATMAPMTTLVDSRLPKIGAQKMRDRRRRSGLSPVEIDGRPFSACWA